MVTELLASHRQTFLENVDAMRMRNNNSTNNKLKQKTDEKKWHQQTNNKSKYKPSKTHITHRTTIHQKCVTICV